MKKRKSFFRRHIIAVTFIVLVGIYSAASTINKEIDLRKLVSEGQLHVERIRQLEDELKAENKELAKIDTLKFIEESAREKFKMVHPNEIYFQVTSDDDEEKEE